MTAFQSMMLLSCGAPLIPAGGSCCSRLKSRISRFLAGVDISASQTFGSGGQAPIPRRAPGTAAPAGSPPGARRERRSFAASEREAGGRVGRERVRKGADAGRERRDVTSPFPRESSRYPHARIASRVTDDVGPPVGKRCIRWPTWLCTTLTGLVPSCLPERPHSSLTAGPALYGTRCQ